MSNLNEEDIAAYQEKQKFLEEHPFLKNNISYDLWEWSKLITELSEKERDLIELKDIIFDKNNG